MPRYKLTDELAPATISEADGVRYLHLGTPWVQGAMRIRKPHTLELEYIQRMMVWTLMREPADLTKGHAVQLGLGSGAITRFCHRNMKMKTTVVELNPTVIGVCKLWFHLPDDDARLTVLNMDAGRYVADSANAEAADVLNVDLYDHEAASPVLDDEVFYANCHRLLADGGVMTVNLFGRDASFARSARLIAQAFGPDNVRSIQPTKEGNTVVLAVKAPAGERLAFPDRSTLAARAENIETRFGLPAKKWLRMIRQLPGEAPAATPTA
jgi:spermidine synthase